MAHPTAIPPTEDEAIDDETIGVYETRVAEYAALAGQVASAAFDALGRRYTYVGEAELTVLLEAAGFEVEATFGGESRGLDGVGATWTGRLAGVRPG